jgi:GT2 family glycosyltransferase
VQPPSVAIIIVNYRGWHDTLECLASLRGLTYPNFRVYLVDQASDNSASQTVRDQFPEVRLIENPVNDGFAGGSNRGIQAAFKEGTDYLFLLNNDTTVAQNLLEPLVSLAESDARIGVVGPLILYYDEPEIVWSAGGRINARGDVGQSNQGKLAVAISPEPQETDFIVGCGLLVKRTVLEKVGILDETYFLYFEETDLCARIRNAGYTILMQPASCLWHKVSRTAGQDSELTYYYMRRNHLLYMRRYGDSFLPIVAGAIDIVRLALVFALRGQLKRSRILLRALWDFLTGNFGKAKFAV